MKNRLWIAIGVSLLGLECGTRTDVDIVRREPVPPAGDTSGSGTIGASGSPTGTTTIGMGSVSAPGSSPGFVGSAPSRPDAGGDSVVDAGCGNLMDDPLNCGWCGHDCMGAVCSSGTCG
jgi:hypothetical protein